MFDEMIQILNENENSSDNKSKYVLRRNNLLKLISEAYPKVNGKVLFFSPVEVENQIFLQDSSFYYFTGITEPACAISFDNVDGSVLYQPNFGENRKKWVYCKDIIDEKNISSFGIDSLKLSGDKILENQVFNYFSENDYKNIIDLLKNMAVNKQTLFTLYPNDKRQYVGVRQIIDRLLLFVPEIKPFIVDVSLFVEKLRRKKDLSEIEHLYKSIGITQTAIQAASRVLKDGANEAELCAAIEYIFIENQSRPAYPVIVAGGKMATVLHYNVNNNVLKKGDLVLIDAGACYKHYCADITRVLPVSGKFSKRQKELYKIVLETQQHVVDNIRPGMWLSNEKEQDLSLQHIALKFLKQSGYDSYFIHGIGHYLGLDVHDVGSKSQPLQEGDVITVEPGIYLPDESIGIRIEDNYWVVKDSAPVCLSEDIPKSIKEIEDMVQERFDVDVE